MRKWFREGLCKNNKQSYEEFCQIADYKVVKLKTLMSKKNELLLTRSEEFRFRFDFLR